MDIFYNQILLFYQLANKGKDNTIDWSSKVTRIGMIQSDVKADDSWSSVYEIKSIYSQSMFCMYLSQREKK